MVFEDVGRLVAGDRERLEDVLRRDARGLPREQEVDRQLAAVQPLAVGLLHLLVPVVHVGGEGDRHAFLPRRPELIGRAFLSLRRSAIRGERRVGAGEVDALLRHLRVLLRRHLLAVRNHMEAGIDRALRSVARLHVRVDLRAAPGRFADEELDVVDRVAPRLAVEADLDHLRPEQQILADRLDDLVAAVGLEVLRIHDVVALVHLRRRVELSAGGTDDEPRRNDRRPRDPSLLDRRTQRRIGVQAVVADIANNREARGERLQGIGRCLDRPQRRRVGDVGVVIDVVLRDLLVGHRFVRVRVDEAGEHGHPRQVDDLGAGRNRHVRADVPNPLAFGHDDLVGRRSAGLRVNQTPGPDGRGFLRSGRLPSASLGVQARAREAEQGGRDDDALQHECFSSSVRSTDTFPPPRAR